MFAFNWIEEPLCISEHKQMNEMCVDVCVCAHENENETEHISIDSIEMYVSVSVSGRIVEMSFL